MKCKLAVFSDIHGNLQALEAILNDINNNDYDEVYCLGDVIALGPNPKECLDLIIKNNIKLILGNHELYYLRGTNIEKMNDSTKLHQFWIKKILNHEYEDYLNTCPLVIEKKIGKHRICFEHFLIKDNKLQYPFEELSITKDESIKCLVHSLSNDITIIGHEHNPFTIVSNNKLICIGSSGLLKDDNTFYYSLENVNDNLIIKQKNIKYDRKKLVNTLNNTEYPDKSIISKYFFGINNDDKYESKKILKKI